MTEYEFMLADRVAKIKSINELYNLENNAYISFSGGKDSTVLSALIDIALPGNKIPRVFINTGIEYKAITEFIKEVEKNDSRLQIIQPSQNIRQMLQEQGYPMKSKEHSNKLAIYQRNGDCKVSNDYLGKGERKIYLCPSKLRYQFSPDFKIKVSDRCCHKLKKEPAEKWAKENNRFITMTGMRQDEGGSRQALKSCTVFYDKDNKKLRKFHPLFVVDENWINQFIIANNIKCCSLYYPPYNFERTGCCGCPFSLTLQKDLDILEKYFPAERKKVELIWKPVYEEYRRIGYRLRKEDNQPTLFD